MSNNNKAKKHRKGYFPRCCGTVMSIIDSGSKGISAKLKCGICNRKIS